jgi:hypothetical protein
VRDRLYDENQTERLKFIQEFIAANRDKIENLPNYKAVRAAHRRLAKVAAGKKRSKTEVTDGASDLMVIAQAKIDWMNLGYSESEVYAIGVHMMSAD